MILFLLLFANHPFEGAKVVACPCLTESYERKFYGSEALFIYDADDKSNLPVRGIHMNVIRRWAVFPQKLKDAFIAEFSQEKLKKPQSRIAGILILKNISNESWTVETPNGKHVEVASQAVMPVREGLKISFPREADRAEIKVIINK